MCFLLISGFLTGCFQQEGLLFDSPVIEDKEPAPRSDATILYEANTVGPEGQGLVAKVYNATGDTALVFGEFSPGGKVSIRSLAYAKMESDTVMHLFFEESGLLLSGIALNLKPGRKLNTLLRFEEYISYSCVMSLLSANWMEGRADAQWRWRVDKSTDIPVPAPVYIRDECQMLRPLTQSDWAGDLQQILEVVYERLNNLIYVDPAIFRGPDIVQLQLLLNQACMDTVILQPEAPSPAPFYPDDAFYQLSINDYPCLNHNGMMTRFRTTVDVEGNLIFSEVQGGTPPFSFAVDEFSFRNTSRISGPFDPNRPYLLMVRDGNGCISSRIGYLERPVQEACGIVCGKTWSAFEARMEQESGFPAFEENCDLLNEGCRSLATGYCNDGAALDYSDFTLAVEQFQLSFGNTGKVTVSQRFRYSARQQLNRESCSLESLDDNVVEETTTYFWYARTPQLLIIFNQEDVFGRLHIEGVGNLRFERYDPVRRTTLSVGLTVQ